MYNTQFIIFVASMYLIEVLFNVSAPDKNIILSQYKTLERADLNINYICEQPVKINKIL